MLSELDAVLLVGGITLMVILLGVYFVFRGDRRKSAK